MNYRYYRDKVRFAAMLARLQRTACRTLDQTFARVKTAGVYPSPPIRTGTRTAAPEYKRSGNSSPRSNMKIKTFAIHRDLLFDALESHVSKCVPEAKAVTSSVRRGLSADLFPRWCLMALSQDIVGEQLVWLYQAKEASTCETIIAVLEKALKKDPLVQAEFLRVAHSLRELVTW